MQELCESYYTDLQTCFIMFREGKDCLIVEVEDIDYMADSFKCIKISNKQNNTEHFSHQDKKKIQQTHATQAGDRAYEKEEKHQDSEEHFERFSDFDYEEDEPQQEYNFIEQPRQKQCRIGSLLPPQKNTKPTCGCGHAPCSTNKQLYFHISKNHGGIAPPGTIIGYFKAKSFVKPQFDHRARLMVQQVPMNNRGENSYRMQGSKYSEGNTHPIYASQQSERSYSNNQYTSNRKQVKEQSDSKALNRGPFVCSICNTMYSSKWAFNLHFLIKHPSHSSEKQRDPSPNIQRKIPGRRPNISYNEVERPFKCECGKSYTHPSALGLHNRKKHNGYYIKDMEQQKKSASEDLFNKEIQKHLRAQRLAEQGKNQEGAYFQSQVQQQVDWQQNEAGEFLQANVEQLKTVDQIVDNELKSVHKCACGRNYSCSSALGLHIRRKHKGVFIPGTIGAPKSFTSNYKPVKLLPKPQPYREINKCGCGRVYTCQDFLNKHIKISHEGVAPEGTIEGSKYLEAGDNYVQPLKHSEVQQIFRCGCGRTYTHECFLSLHIKRHHYGIAPSGTTGCAKDIPRADQYQPYSFACQICNTKELKSHFKCLTCASHLICSKCFWSGSYFSPEHQWVIKTQDSE